MAGFGRLMCPLDVLRGLSVLTCSGTTIIPRLVSRLTYDHLFTLSTWRDDRLLLFFCHAVLWRAWKKSTIINRKNILNAPHKWNDQFIDHTHFCTDPLTSRRGFFWNFIASPGFVNVFSISTWSFSLTILTFKPSATPIRYFYLKAPLKVSHIKWPHQMHWNT